VSDRDETYESLMSLLWLGVALLVAVPLKGVAVALYWRWFIVPLGVPDISLMHAIGFGLFVSMFQVAPAKRSGTMTHDEKLKVIREGSLNLVLAPLLHMAFGWVTHWCMVNG
jgi:hypothetical protein